MASIDVRAIRTANKMTQAAFASTYQLPIGMVRDWEQGRRRPDAGSAVLLRMIEVDATGVERLLAKMR